ncbi:MAG: hypothetical protein ABIA04_08310 [Pseudomonadota bacterium]
MKNTNQKGQLIIQIKFLVASIIVLYFLIIKTMFAFLLPDIEEKEAVANIAIILDVDSRLTHAEFFEEFLLKLVNQGIEVNVVSREEKEAGESPINNADYANLKELESAILDDDKTLFYVGLDLSDEFSVLYYKTSFLGKLLSENISSFSDEWPLSYNTKDKRIRSLSSPAIVVNINNALIVDSDNENLAKGVAYPIYNGILKYLKFLENDYKSNFPPVEDITEMNSSLQAEALSNPEQKFETDLVFQLPTINGETSQIPLVYSNLLVDLYIKKYNYTYYCDIEKYLEAGKFEAFAPCRLPISTFLYKVSGKDDERMLSEYVTAGEFVSTATERVAKKEGRDVLIYATGGVLRLIDNLNRLAENFGYRAPRITSGFRDAGGNKAVPGTSSKSGHMEGRCVDFSSSSGLYGQVGKARFMNLWSQARSVSGQNKKDYSILIHDAGTGMHVHTCSIATPSSDPEAYFNSVLSREQGA